MTEYERLHEARGRHINQNLSLDDLPVTSDDPATLALWEEGLARWGTAFLAFTRLRTPELRSPEVLSSFPADYLGSFESMEECLNQELEDLDWAPHLRRFLVEEGIPENVLVWDYDAFERLFRGVYDVVEVGDEVHVFAK